MLTVEERHRVLICISYIFSICLLPGRVKVQTWEFNPRCASKLKSRACKTSYFLFIAHALYKIGRLLSEYLFLNNIIPLHQVIIHLIVAAATALMVYWYYFLFVKYPDVCLGLMKMTFSGSFSQSKHGTTGMPFARDLQDLLISVFISRVTETRNAPASGTAKSRRQLWYKRLLECSPQDLIALYLPYMVLCSIAFIGACYVYDPTLRLLLYSALPERHQNWLTFLICFVEEMRLVSIIAGIGVAVLEIQINTFEEVTNHLEANIMSAMNRYCS